MKFEAAVCVLVSGFVSDVTIFCFSDELQPMDKKIGHVKVKMMTALFRYILIGVFIICICIGCGLLFNKNQNRG